MKTIMLLVAATAVTAGVALLLPAGPRKPLEAAAQAPQFDGAFWKIWGDGQAELSAYDLTYPRYGKPRRGVAVAIFVTEPFAGTPRVKADPGKHPDSDVFPVMKLNLVEDFQTGVYDYNEETSSFLALARTPGQLTKVSFSSQEWCGHVYAQALFDPGAIRLTTHSYFDGEADEQKTLPAPAGGVTEEQLFFWARGMAAPPVQRGQAVSVPYLPALQTSRHEHKPPAWGRARLSRAPATQEVSVPAGRYRAEVFRAEWDNGGWRTFWVEEAAPHRLIQWENSAGERAQLLGVDRMKYWQMNQPGGEEALKKLGLSVRPPRTP